MGGILILILLFCTPVNCSPPNNNWNWRDNNSPYNYNYNYNYNRPINNRDAPSTAPPPRQTVAPSWQTTPPSFPLPPTSLNGLDSSVVSLVNNIIGSLGDTPPDGQVFSQNDIRNLNQAANLTQQALDQARGGIQQFDSMDSSMMRDYGTQTRSANESKDSGTMTYGYGPPPPPYYDPYYDPNKHDPPKKKSDTAMQVGLGVGISLLIILILLFIGYMCYKRRRSPREPHGLFPLPLPKVVNSYVKQDNSPPISSHDHWELNRVNLSINYDKKLGSGAFCNVFKGQIIGDAPVSLVYPGVRTSALRDCAVAVKMLPSFADDIARSDFMQEINFMKSLAYHPHLVSMLGWVSDRKTPLLLVEYCEKGDLLHFIREKRDEIRMDPIMNPDGLKIKDLLSFSWQISNGLEYLNSVGCIHRDVAARNVLVDSHNQCKIGDFGLCRLTDSLLYTARGGRLPLKWMAPESLTEYEYSFKSDVWSYSVCLWELFSLGEVPFSLIQTTELLEHLQRGDRLAQPEYCPTEVFEVMSDCWEYVARDRPTFRQICSRFAAMLELATESYGYLVPTNRAVRDSSITETQTEHV